MNISGCSEIDVYLTCVATALTVDTVNGFALVATPPSGDVPEKVAASAFCPL